MAVTLQDIARELELSANTVSRALRHDTAINTQTRARVNEAATRLGYRAGSGRPRRDAAAHTEVQGLGLLVRYRNLDLMQYDLNFMKTMAGIMSVTDKQGMHLKVHTLPSTETRFMAEDPDVVPPLVGDGSCKALLVHGAHQEKDLLYLTHRLPVVSVSRTYENLDLDASVADNVGGIRRLVEHLVSLGHTQLAWVGAPYRAPFVEAREVGFLHGCRQQGLNLAHQKFFGRELYQNSNTMAASPLLSAVREGISAFVCVNDGTAHKLIQLLHAAGLSIPRDASVTGFDAAASTPPSGSVMLTTVDPHFFEIGQGAARLALQRMNNPRAIPTVLSTRCDIVLGSSTGPAPEAPATR